MEPYWDLYRDYIGRILGLEGDNGEENGNYYNGLHGVQGLGCAKVGKRAAGDPKGLR